MRNFIEIVENLLRDPAEAKSKFNIFTTMEERNALTAVLARKGVVFRETPASSTIAKITFAVEGSDYLYKEIDRAIKLAGLSATTLSAFKAPREDDLVAESRRTAKGSSLPLEILLSELKDRDQDGTIDDELLTEFGSELLKVIPNTDGVMYINMLLKGTNWSPMTKTHLEWLKNTYF